MAVLATLLVTVALLGCGLYAAYTDRDTVLTMVTFVMGFVGLLLTAVQTYPGITRHLRGARRQFVYAVIVIFMAASATATSVILQRPVIKVAVSLPFTGGDKQDALPILRAVRQAVREEHGRIGNFDIQIVPFDDTNAEDRIQLMSSDGETVQRTGSLDTITGDARVAGIIGPFKSGTALVEVPQANASGIPLISPSATRDCLTADRCDGKDMGTSKTFFRTCVADRVRAKVLADFFSAREKPGAKSTEVAILTDASIFGDAFGGAFADEWRVKHPTVDRPILIPLTDDYDTLLKGLNPAPGLVLFAGTGPQGTALYRTMQNDPVLRTATFSGPATIMNGALNDILANGAGGELYAIAPMPYDNTSKSIVDFESAYGSMYGNQLPTPYSASAYDAARSLLIAIREAVGSTRPPISGWNWLSQGQADAFRQKVVTKLRDLNRGTGVRYAGITGTFNYAENGDVSFAGVGEAKTVAIYRYHQRGTGATAGGWRYERFE
ncbi:branched-chain amino acid ABC transporter substrate-binding protein [Micromonospora sp. 067-2]|uniref:branched-chain amino acid ABC transporter substrate-binding protein n=1 Tax=Micromonospora sp. 067-2 TaxID=2789270 RepID=UPI00397E0AB5